MDTRRKTASKKENQEDICHLCKVDISDGGMIECDRCEKWYCKDCSGLNEESFTVFTKYPDAANWFCPQCKIAAVKAVKSDNLIEERCKAHFESFKQEVKEMVTAKFNITEDSIRKTETRLKQEDDSIRKEINDLREDLDRKMSNMVNEAATKSVKEVKERNSRQNNAMVFKLRESANQDPEQRKAEDIVKVNEICNLLNVQIDIIQATRIGKKADNRTRPLKITLQSSHQVESLTKASRKLKDCGRPEYKDVAIKNDMTPLEREEMKRLLRIRDQRREESRAAGENTNWIIRNWEVVKGRVREEEGEET
jgi:hypothetical protein